MIEKLNEYLEWYRNWYNSCIEKSINQLGIPKEYFIIKKSASEAAIETTYDRNRNN